MNTTGLATGGVLGGGLVGAELANQLPSSGPARVAGQAMLAATGGAFLLITIVALSLIVLGVALRVAGRADA